VVLQIFSQHNTGNDCWWAGEQTQINDNFIKNNKNIKFQICSQCHTAEPNLPAIKTNFINLIIISRNYFDQHAWVIISI
jgi:hypothetical protein